MKSSPLLQTRGDKLAAVVLGSLLLAPFAALILLWLTLGVK